MTCLVSCHDGFDGHVDSVLCGDGQSLRAWQLHGMAMLPWGVCMLLWEIQARLLGKLQTLGLQ
jgi:hypothetical protein